VERVCQSRNAWAALSSGERAKVLKACHQCVRQNWAFIASESARLRGIYGNGLGEEMCAFHTQQAGLS
jgi:acyl-CoA reductase-like NAD-dependent aldehyde dehydrogenase